MDLPYWEVSGYSSARTHARSLRILQPALDLLFSGDLFASYGFLTHLPPVFLTAVLSSTVPVCTRVVKLSPRQIIPNHYSGFDGEIAPQKI